MDKSSEEKYTCVEEYHIFLSLPITNHAPGPKTFEQYLDGSM